MWTAATLVLWIGGLTLISWSPLLGGFMLVGGVGSAAKAYDTADDMETFLGLLLCLILLVGVLAVLHEAWSRWLQ